MTIFIVVLLSFIEGLTEFLPVSSTGHLILTSAFLGLNEDHFVQNFNIIIQFGAILSVLVLYWRRFLPIRPDFYLRLFLSFLPAAVLGFLLKSKIDEILGSVTVVASALIVGGVLILIFDSRAEKTQAREKIASLSIPKCLLIGLIQCFAFIPGVSRSAATILGGLWMGLSREEATEYSFFLAVPTLMAAGLYKTYKILPSLDASHATDLGLGIFLSFVFACLAIRFFIQLVEKFGLKHFGWYRIGLGALILILVAGGKL